MGKIVLNSSSSVQRVIPDAFTIISKNINSKYMYTRIWDTFFGARTVAIPDAVTQGFPTYDPRTVNGPLFNVHSPDYRAIHEICHIMSTFYKSRIFKKTLPFIVLLVGGSFGLKQFVDLRYNYKPTVYDLRREMKKSGIEMKPPGEVTLESEYEKLKQVDLDNWENKRIPRPWDEGEIAK